MAFFTLSIPKSSNDDSRSAAVGKVSLLAVLIQDDRYGANEPSPRPGKEKLALETEQKSTVHTLARGLQNGLVME